MANIATGATGASGAGEATPNGGAVPGGAPNRRLADLSAPAAQSLLRPTSVLVQPIAAVEQHGPHLPLSTDLLIADAAADAVFASAAAFASTSASTDDSPLDLWRLPTLAYGASDEHIWAAGTVSMSVTTMLAVLDDLGRSVARLPARRLVFLNSHGGNSALLQVAMRQIRVRHGLETFLVHPFPPAVSRSAGDEPDHEDGWGVHGGHEETSVLLHLHPELVRMELAQPAVPDWPATTSLRLGGGTSFAWTSADLGRDGVIGDPTRATPEAGQTLFQAAVDHVLTGLREVASHGLPPRKVR